MWRRCAMGIDGIEALRRQHAERRREAGLEEDRRRSAGRRAACRPARRRGRVVVCKGRRRLRSLCRNSVPRRYFALPKTEGGHPCPFRLCASPLPPIGAPILAETRTADRRGRSHVATRRIAMSAPTSPCSGTMASSGSPCRWSSAAAASRAPSWRPCCARSRTIAVRRPSCFAMHTHSVAAARPGAGTTRRRRSTALLKRIAGDRIQLLRSGGSDWLAGSGTADQGRGRLHASAARRSSPAARRRPTSS